MPGARRVRSPRTLEPNKIGQDTPLRLNLAAAIAYPDGSMTASGLRREASRGRLVIERVAGRDYVTLSSIARMRQLCQLQPRDHDCGSEDQGVTVEDDSHIRPCGLSSTESIRRAQSAAKTIVAELKEPSNATSIRNISRNRRKGSVIQLRSPSQTY